MRGAGNGGSSDEKILTCSHGGVGRVVEGAREVGAKVRPEGGGQFSYFGTGYSGRAWAFFAKSLKALGNRCEAIKRQSRKT